MKKICSLLVLVAATAFSAWAQQPVTGVAVDETNIPLPGAVILLDGASKTYTDAQGRFSFNKVSDGAHSLVLEYPGYDKVTKTIQAGSHVVLKTSLTANTLSEANVVGSYLQGATCPPPLCAAAAARTRALLARRSPRCSATHAGHPQLRLERSQAETSASQPTCSNG